LTKRLKEVLVAQWSVTEVLLGGTRATPKESKNPAQGIGYHGVALNDCTEQDQIVAAQVKECLRSLEN
jgi:hypothetical protein